MFEGFSKFLQGMMKDGGASLQIGVIVALIVFIIILASMIFSFTRPSMNFGSGTQEKSKSNAGGKSSKVEISKAEYVWFFFILPILMVVTGILGLFG